MRIYKENKLNLQKRSVTIFSFKKSTKIKIKLFLSRFFFYLVPTNDELVVGVYAVLLI